jgi:hypothetical protein
MSSDRFSGLSEGCGDWIDENESPSYDFNKEDDFRRFPGIIESEIVVGVCQINTSGDYWNG